MFRVLSLAAALASLLACASKGPSTPPSAPPVSQPPEQAAAVNGLLSAEQLDVLVARVALYPDELLALVLAASTQPLQIVEASRFLRVRESEPGLPPMEDWDPAVKSLLNYPEVIRLMSEDLRWTQALGNAVSSQQADVMEAIQQVRTRAMAAGNLKTNDQQVITQEQEVIVIRSADPQVICVPAYDPTVIYVVSSTPVVTSCPPYPCYWCPSAAYMGMWMGFGWYYHDIYWDHDHDHDDDIDIDIDRPDRPDRPERPSHPDRPVWKPGGGTNRPARPATLPSQPGIGTVRPEPRGTGTGAPIGMDRLTKLPPGYPPGSGTRPSTLPGTRPGYERPSTQESFGDYQRGRDAVRESQRGAQSRGLSSPRSPSYGNRSTWGGYGADNRADAWGTRGAASRGSMPGGFGGRGGFGGGGGRGGGGRGR
jgi:hypothetical protein